MDENKLKLLGLNTYEVKVFKTLLYKGKSKASFISQDSGVPNGKIYDTLASLEEKGLIAIIPQEVKYFVAKPITQLKELLKEKQKQLQDLDKELKELENLTQEHIKGEILLVKGKKGFHNLMKNLKQTNNVCYTIKWKADTTDMNFQKGFKNIKKRVPDVKTIYDYNTPKENIKFWEKYQKEYKFIESDKVAIEINDEQVFISIIELNSTILITSKNFAKVMQQLFKAYYDNN